MKKTLVLLALGSLFAGTAAAKDSTGCGLGTMIFDGKSGVAPQILAVTTNGTLGNQTFGITSGTLGCDQDGTVSSSQKLGMFMGDNLDRVAQDASRGGGEALATVAELMGVVEADRAAFYAAVKTHFGDIFTSEDVTAGEALANLKAVIAKDETLAAYAS